MVLIMKYFHIHRVIIQKNREVKYPFKRYNAKESVICENKTVNTGGTFRNFRHVPLFDSFAGRLTRAECISVCLCSNGGRGGG
jgi:hypothetical protein